MVCSCSGRTDDGAPERKHHRASFPPFRAVLRCPMDATFQRNNERHAYANEFPRLVWRSADRQDERLSPASMTESGIVCVDL